MRLVSTFGLALLLAWTFVLNLFHAGVYPPPPLDLSVAGGARFYPASERGLNHMIAEGSAYKRGLDEGRLTRDLLAQQEQVLNDQAEGWLPNRYLRQVAVLGLIAWFQGIDRYIQPEYVEEMYGVSASAPAKYDYLVDGFTRQIAYHGLHEVGQMMVDQGFEAMGCTVIAIKRGANWILGRNFDFEGGRIFDTQKILKWVFPEVGHAFVSVIWAGMVGAVTGVNDQGVYISINAAGSQDHARVGNPSTLVLLQVLQEANTVDDALRILGAAHMFITDIFVVSDAFGRAVRVEKSPERMAFEELKKNSAVSNHLVTAAFGDDPTNLHRREALTTVARGERGQKLADAVDAKLTNEQTLSEVLRILRDKGVDDKGRPLALGNRRAIDALIATHAVLYDSERRFFYVSQGPALAGAFIGFDLKKSFAAHEPVEVGRLPRDPLVSDAKFYAIKEAQQEIGRAASLVRRKQCAEAQKRLGDISEREQSPYYATLGDALECLNDHAGARAAWTKAMELTPAYAKDEDALKERLAR